MAINVPMPLIITVPLRNRKMTDTNSLITEPTFINMDDSEIVQSVIEIFFGQLSSNKDKTNAKEAAKQIRETVINYKQKSKP